ncbi:hypothetical protein PAAG_02696 [Paracoccidioides lutzii Pb01]|uniref:Uncharacterized protein n=1 Tax=Paracoccidioides lutzii (strain ATCC MYA-826 / Pb01) TaxID=502779 RepID=C1GW01_PARBA|nr:hypothetical protein PAAG_02696 [Paracoccidioides lutzii Pb01]EEH40720.1 hypothetical protein PAAG_02696 [Paracoccidioides lutzii Pb01]
MEDSTTRPETPMTPRRNDQQDAALGTPFLGRIFGLPNNRVNATPRPHVSEQETTTPIQAAEMPTTLSQRPSRASSIVSTMTSSTIATLQDDARSTRSVRSVDILLGGKLFHINRDGSKISVSADSDLPPYSPPVPAYTPFSGQLNAGTQDDSQPPEPATPTGPTPMRVPSPTRALALAPAPSPTPAPTQRSRMHIPFWMDRPRHRRQSSSISQDNVRASLGLLNSNSMFDLSKLPSANRSNADSETLDENGVYRSPSFNPGPERISVVPTRRSASQGNIATDNIHSLPESKDASYLRRRNGVRLPKLFTSLANIQFGSSSDQEQDQDTTSSGDHITHSAGPSFGSRQRKFSQSPEFIAHGTSSGFLTPSYSTHLSPNDGPYHHSSSLPNIPTHSLVVPQSPAKVEEGHADTETPPPMEDENDVSIHYTRLIRSIDRDHRKALHVRDQELATMRERLNDIDQVYRQELRSRDFTIDDLRQRLENLQKQMTESIERAKNEVDDMWEMRWKDRDRHLVERMRRIEIESQIQVEKAVADRDEEWAAEWEKRNSVLLERLRIAESRSAGQSLRTP